jgi:hypothetical protein
LAGPPLLTPTGHVALDDQAENRHSILHLMIVARTSRPRQEWRRMERSAFLKLLLAGAGTVAQTRAFGMGAEDVGRE